MEDPNFPVTITVGGTGQSYKFSAFPKEMHANQSFILTATIQKADLSAYDLSSATATLYVSGWKNTISPVTLVGGVIVSNTITFTVPKDLIPESLGGLPLRNPGNSVFYFIVEDTDSILQFFQPVNVLDTNYTLSGDVDSSPNVITPDKNDLGTVVQVNLNTPPGAPTFEDAYIVGTSPTGDWVGQNNDLAVYNGSSWVFYDTVEGNFVFDSNTSQQYIFNGTTWGATAAVTYSDGESINDNNGNELIQFGVVGSAVNEVKITNAATGNGPIIAPAGETNIDLNINATGTGVIKAGSNLDLNGNTINLSKGADVASAGALTLGTDGNYFDITGTTTITSIATLGIGTQVTLHFDGALTLTHHATDLILPSGANITTAAGDEFTFVEYASGDWRCIGYVLASGEAIVGGAGGGGTFNNQTGTTYTLVLADGDGNTTVTMNNASANTLTIPTNASVAIGTDIAISVLQKGAGSTTISGDTGVTVNGVSGGSVEIGNQYSGAVLTKTGTDTWIVTVGGAGGGGSFTYLGTSGAISAAASVEFTTAGWFDGTYDLLIFEVLNLSPSTDNVRLNITGSTDGGSTYLGGTDYEYSAQSRTSGGTNAQGDNSGTSSYQPHADHGIGNVSSESYSGTIRLFTPNSSLNKRFTHLCSYGIANGDFAGGYGQGAIKTTSAVDAIKFAMSSGNIASGEILVYGVTA